MAYDKLAQKGRYGDTEIRNVAGRKSHVNRKESNLIDLYGMLGERLVRDAGAGTINPKTGLPEYHGSKRNYAKPPVGHPGHHTQAELNEERRKKAERKRYADAPDEFDKDVYMEAQLKGEGEQYLLDIGIPDNKIAYFESNIDVKGVEELAADAKTLTEEGATLSETQAEAQYGTEGEVYTGAQTAFDIGTKGLAEGRRGAEAQFGLGMEQAGLTAGRSLFSAKQQADVAAAKSGFATQGTVTGITQRAQKGVFQDYTTQQKQLAEAKSSAMTGFDIQGEGLTESLRSTKAGADIAYGGVMGYGTAAVGTEGEEGYVAASEDYVAGSASIGRKQADLTYRTKLQTLGQQAADEWWDTYEATNV